VICGFPAAQVLGSPDGAVAGGRHSVHMGRRGYAVWWSEGDGPRQAGKLEFGRLHVLLSGNEGARIAVPVDEIAGTDYGRGELTVRRRTRPLLRIGSLDAPGALREVASSLMTAIRI
jgi:hypothetical protein